MKIDAVSKQEYDDATAQLDQANAAVAVAEAAVDVAQVNLDYTKVYAPISGRISRSFVTEGTLVTANQEQYLATITQLDPIYVDMQQSGEEAMVLRSRMLGKESIPVTLTLSSQTKTLYPHEGTLKFSEVTLDETTGSIALRALLPNPDGLLLPGLFTRATLNLGEENVLLVPQRATIRGATGDISVWIIENNKAQPRTIQVSHTHKDSWIVTDGLKAGDEIIIEGYQKVGPGTEVKTTPWQKDKPKTNQQAQANPDHKE